MKPAVFYNQAKSELDDALAWYELRRSGLGRAFQVAVEDTVRRICDNPQAGSRHGTTRFRCLLVRRFPYVVFYAEDRHVIRIMAVAHASRKPDYWKNREV